MDEIAEMKTRFEREREEDRAWAKREVERREEAHKMYLAQVAAVAKQNADADARDEERLKLERQRLEAYERDVEDVRLHRRRVEEQGRAQALASERIAVALERLAAAVKREVEKDEL